MAFRKFNSVEKFEVVTPAENEQINQRVASAGKESYADLNEKQRESVCSRPGGCNRYPECGC